MRFIEYQETPIALGQRSQTSQKSWLRQNHSGIRHHRLGEHRCDILSSERFF